MSKLNLYLAATISLQTGATFGYSVGFVGGVLVLPSFLHHFRLSDLPASELAHAQSFVVSSWIVGAFFGVPCGIPVCRLWGRRLGLIVSAALYLVGAIMQVIEGGGLVVFELGRLINGLGVGFGTLVAPIYISEISTATDRGVLMSAFQVVIQGTALIGFWAAYAANAVIRNTSNYQWQIPVGLQLIPGAILLLGTLLIKETPNYLAANASLDEVEESLSWFRGLPSTDPDLRLEASTIYQSVHSALRRQALQPRSFIREAIRNPIRKRLIVGIGLFIAQNATGMNALNYFVPLIFIRIANSVSGALFLTGIFGAVKLISAFIYMFYCVRVCSNRFWMLGGTAVCAVCMFVLGYCTDGGSSDQANSLTVRAFLAVASVYMFAMAFGLSLGPIAWNVCSEIFPSNLNAQCCAVTTCTQWLCQIVVAALTPILLAKIGTNTFTVFGACTGFGFLFCWAFVPETRGIAVGKDMAKAFGQDFKDDDDSTIVQEVEDVSFEETPLLSGESRKRRRSSVAIVV